MLEKLALFAKRPALFAPSSAKFWDDPHISKGMLAAHLHPNWDAATRNHSFMMQSAAWIASIMPPRQYPELLDLGCGPGLYAKQFHDLGYHVTGIDISERSIQYGQQQAQLAEEAITYIHGSYLALDIEEQFDVATLIYCDYGVLSDQDRKTLLGNVYRALKPNGKLLLDVFTPKQHQGKPESKDWRYQQDGFWKEGPHVCLEQFYRFDEDNTVLSQTIVMTENAVDCYNVWDHVFDAAALKAELEAGGFKKIHLYSDVAGAQYHPDSTVLCAVAEKGNGI